jgi:hypothetical protein
VTFVDKAMSTKIGRPTIRRNGKPLTDTERKRRWRAKKKAQQKARQDAERRARRVEVNGQLGILPLAIASITEVDLASNSVDAIITDPPYAEVDLPLYGELACLAMRVLKPSGWCVVMVGDLYLSRIATLMTQSGLVERGLITVIFPGCHHSRIYATGTFQMAKTILLLQKPPERRPPSWGPNLITASKNGHDKRLHLWQQSQPVFEKLVERFTVPGKSRRRPVRRIGHDFARRARARPEAMGG